MIEMKKFASYEEMSKALYVLKLYGISATAYYGDQFYSNGGLKVDGVGAELSIEEYKDVLMKRAEMVAQAKEDDTKKQKEALKKVPGWIIRAANYLSAEQLNSFEQYVFKCVEGKYHGNEIEEVLDVVDYILKDDVRTIDMYKYVLSKKTPSGLLIKIINDYFYSGFYTMMETQKLTSSTLKK